MTMKSDRGILSKLSTATVLLSLAGLIVVELLSGLVQAASENEEASAAPAHPILLRPPIFQFEGHRPAFELVGIDLTQAGISLQGNVPELEAGIPLDLTLHIRPTSTSIAKRQLLVNIRRPGIGPAPGYLQRFDLDLGDWEFREVIQKTFRIDLPRHRFVGRGALRIAEVDPSDADWKQAAALYVMPVNMPPQIWPSNVQDRRLRQAFGDRWTRLNAAFTLASGAEVVVSLAGTEGPLTGVGIISSVAWHDDLSPGDPICQVTTKGAVEASAVPYSVLYGETTYMSVVAAATEAGDTAKAELAWSDPFTSQDGVNKRRCFYKGTIDFSNEVSPTDIVFKYQGDAGMLNVFEVVVFFGP